jgi:hypothetical protein
MARNAVQITRPVNVTTITVHNSAIASSTRVDNRDFAGGSIALAAGETVTTFTYYGAHTATATLVPLYDKLGTTAITQTVAASRIYALPDEVYGLPYFAILGNAAATPTLCQKG